MKTTRNLLLVALACCTSRSTAVEADCSGALEGSLRFDVTTGTTQCCDEGRWWAAGDVQATGACAGFTLGEGAEPDGPTPPLLVVSPSVVSSLEVVGPCAQACPVMSSSVDIIVSNVGQAASVPLSLTLTGSPAFALTRDQCSGTALPAQASCSVSVAALASADGGSAGRLEVMEHNAPSVLLASTATGFGCMPERPGPGGVIIGCATDYSLVAAPSGCGEQPMAPSCTGGQDTVVRSWQSARVTRGDTVRSDVDGAQNTVNLMDYSAREGLGTHEAAEYCSALVTSGFDDWYLPSRAELALLVSAKGALQLADDAAYWSSTEYAQDVARFLCTGPAPCASIYSQKEDPLLVRCVRRQGRPLPQSTVPVPPQGQGYLVLTSQTTNGDTGGLTGADAFCLSDLVGSDWQGKSDAQARGLLNRDHVYAFLCTGAVGMCNNARPLTTYAFAVAGSPTLGGSTVSIAADGSGLAPQVVWSALNYFGSVVDYWSNRGTVSDAIWATTGANVDQADTCRGHNSALAADVARIATSNATGRLRWASINQSCSSQHRLVCFVHP